MTINNGDMPAIPVANTTIDTSVSWDDATAGGRFVPLHGLTKREMIAMAAMQGLRSHSGDYHTFANMASDAVNYADALIAELERTK